MIEENVRKRSTLTMDGVEETSADEFHSFLVRIGHKHVINIPRDIGRYLNLSEESILLVAIKVADKEIMEEYKYDPKRKRPGKSTESILVDCPVCGEQGRLYIHTRDHRSISGSTREYKTNVYHPGYYCYILVDVARERGWAPPLEIQQRRRMQRTKPQVECPNCGEMGSLCVSERLAKHRNVSGEVSIYKYKYVKIYHSPGDACYIQVRVAREKGWI